MDEEVALQFAADVEEAVASVQELAATARELADNAREAQGGLDGVRDSAFEMEGASDTAALSAGELRDRLAEVAAAAGIYRDEMGKLRDAQGRFVAESTLQDLALGKTRDKALEAAAAFKAEASELKNVRDKAAEAAGSGGLGGVASLLSRFFSGTGGSGGFTGGLSGILSKLPLVGEQLGNIVTKLGETGGEGGTGLVETLGSVAGSGAGLAVIAGIVGAVATEAGALATGLTAAGLGVGGFAALAIPAFKDVSGAYQQIHKDQQAYDRALTATAKSSALKHLQQDLAGLDPAERGALQGVQQLSDEYHKLSKAFEPTAFKVFNEGLKVANQLLPYVGQFANAAAPAIEGLLSNLSKGLGSPAFKHFMSFLESLSGPVITAIGSGMSGLAKDVMQLMESFSKKDVINAINIAFRVIGFALTVLIGIIQGSMATWDWLTQTALPAVRGAFDTTRHTIASWGHDVAQVFDTARHDVATAGHDIAHGFDTARHEVARAADGIKNAVVSAVTRVVNMVKNDWKNVVGWLALPVLMAAGEIYTHIHEIAQTFDGLRHDAAAIFDGMRHDTAAAFDGLRHDVATAWDNIRHDIAKTVDAIPGDIRKEWDQVRHDAAAFGDGLLHDAESIFTSVWHYITSTTSSGASQLLGVFQRLPGEILGFLEQLPGDMVTMGENIVGGMIRGVESMGGALINAIESIIPSPIKSLMSAAFSLGSPSRLFHQYGTWLVEGLINGVREMQPHLQSAMRTMTGAVSAAGSLAAQDTASAYAASAVAPAGGMSHHMTVTVNAQGTQGTGLNDPRYQQELQAAVQEVTLRYAVLNPVNGLTPAWGR